MNNSFIAIDTAAIKRIADGLDKLPDEAADLGVENANEYLLNVERMNAPYKYVSIAEQGGFKSDKQRRYVMAAIRYGRITIPYSRTQTLSQGWQLLGSGRNQLLVNETPYAQYVKDLPTQSYGHMLRGWKTLQEDIIERGAEIVRRFDAGVKNAIKRLGL